jgi:uncharacterized protein (TIGR04551 family)
MTRLVGLLILALATAAPTVAWAQIGPGTTTPGGAEEDKAKGDGVAEAAPKAPGLLPTTPTLPPPKGKRNRFELFELDGYFRMRGDYFKNLHLGFKDNAEQGGAPFPRALGCTRPDDGAGAVGDRPCEDSLKSSNIRLRFEPRINVNETTSVHAQIDVLDNYVLGSVPRADEQSPVPTPLVSTGNTIAVKRAWAEVVTPLGILKFGRQPTHWGLGILDNAGGEDPINGGYDFDSDYGDTVDRLMFSTLIPGTPFRAGIAYDWPRTFPTSEQSPETAGRSPQPWDLDDNDDVNQWALTLSKMGSMDEFTDTVARGKLALDYGVYFIYRTQGWDYTAAIADDPEPADPGAFVPRDMTIYMPDVWLRVGYRKLLFELEALTSFGSIERVADLGLDRSVSVRQWGGVGRVSFRALDDKLRFGIEAGAASGDQWDNVVEGRTHLSNAQFRGPDGTFSRFAFDRDYKVDLILFRELIGAVSNAAYGKPFLSYDLTKTITMKVANITSFALKPVATPGNEVMWGSEFDADIGLTTSSFHAGLAYGILFPLGAMDHPADPSGRDAFSYDTDIDPSPTITDINIGDAGTAHTLQLRLVVKF